MSKKTQKPRQQDAAVIAGGDLDTSMFWFGDLNVWGAFPTAPTVYQKPRAQVFYMARNWFERQVFLKAITLLKFDIYNYGLHFAVGPLPDGASKADRVAADKKNVVIQKWYDENKLTVMKFVRDAWQEWFCMDNAIAVWCKNCPPVLYPIEHLTYQDDFGIEALSFAHGLSPEKIDQMTSLSLTARTAMKAGKDLTLMKQGKATTNGLFQFETLKRTRVGVGLAWPQIRTLFNSVGTWESLELADWQLADALRTVYEMHLIGHEIKNGNRAGFPDHFLKSKRAAAINKIIGGGKGGSKQTLAAIKRLVVNFDHKVEYPRPDPKHFGNDRYEGVLERMMYWSMPIGQMLFAKQMNPWHGQFLKAKAQTERGFIGPFIEAVLKQSLGAPEGITAAWSDDVFMDPRLMLDTLKTGLTSGPLSQETFLEKTGHKPQKERARKDTENDLPTHQVRPVWDGAHGINPNDPEAGRPPGSGDRKQRNSK